MQMHFFTIPIADPQGATEALNAFLTAHRVVHVERHFVADGANSAWALCVSTVEGEGRPPAADRRQQQKKIDDRETLSAPYFANASLNPLERFLLATSRIAGAVRYLERPRQPQRQPWLPPRELRQTLDDVCLNRPASCPLCCHGGTKTRTTGVRVVSCSRRRKRAPVGRPVPFLRLVWCSP